MLTVFDHTVNIQLKKCLLSKIRPLDTSEAVSKLVPELRNLKRDNAVRGLLTQLSLLLIIFSFLVYLKDTYALNSSFL